MERRTCNLCFRSFSNGRALCGHMRSHFAAATAGTATAVKPQLSNDISTSTSLQEAQTIFQDTESETEILPIASFPTGHHRRRSKRPRRSSSDVPALLDSVSDVALCLMMLSRDVWDGEDYRADGKQKAADGFQCRSCKRIFGSYQALGGHRANHKKSRGCTVLPSPESNDNNGTGDGKTAVHECPFCFRVFSSGQALGGHKRSHLASSITTATIASPPVPSPPRTTPGASKLCKTLFDLNLPAAADEEDMEISAVSDHESAVSHRPLKW